MLLDLKLLDYSLKLRKEFGLTYSFGNTSNTKFCKKSGSREAFLHRKLNYK